MDIIYQTNMPLTRQQLEENILSLEKQGAPRNVIQQYLNTLKKGGELYYKSTEEIPKEKPKGEKGLKGVVVGATKGIFSTLASVPKNIEKVARGAVEALKGTKTQESLSKSYEANLAVFKKAKTETDPIKKQKLLDQATATYQQLEGLSSQEREVPRIPAIQKAEEILTPQTGAEKFGYGAEKLAEFFVPGGAVRKAEKGIEALTMELPKFAQKTINIAGKSLAEGLSAGAVVSAQGAELDEVGRATLMASLFSVPFKAAKELGLAKAFKKAGEKTLLKALAPSKDKFKEKAAKIVPEMLKRKVKFGTLEGLQAKADIMADDLRQAINEAWDALPETAKTNVAPIIEKMEGLKKSLVIKSEQGADIIPDIVKGKWNAISGLQKEMLSIAGGNTESVSLRTLRQFRQILDNITSAKGRGTYNVLGTEADVLLAGKELANSLRTEIAKEIPSIAKLNAEFNFWNNVKDVASETLKRQTGKSSIISKLLGGQLGAGIGGATGVGIAGGGIGAAIGGGVGAVALPLLAKLIGSPAWKSLSSLTKNNIANMLAKGDGAVINVINRLLVGGKEKQQPQEIQTPQEIIPMQQSSTTNQPFQTPMMDTQKQSNADKIFERMKVLGFNKIK